VRLSLRRAKLVLLGARLAKLAAMRRASSRVSVSSPSAGSFYQNGGGADLGDALYETPAGFAGADVDVVFKRHQNFYLKAVRRVRLQADLRQAQERCAGDLCARTYVARADMLERSRRRWRGRRQPMGPLGQVAPDCFYLRKRAQGSGRRRSCLADCAVPAAPLFLVWV
jgi:hypothetical protein